MARLKVVLGKSLFFMAGPCFLWPYFQCMADLLGSWPDFTSFAKFIGLLPDPLLSFTILSMHGRAFFIVLGHTSHLWLNLVVIGQTLFSLAEHSLLQPNIFDSQLAMSFVMIFI